MSTQTLTKAEQRDRNREEAIAELRKLFPPRSEVPVVLRHVSSSGMLRTFSVLAIRNGAIVDVSYLVARAGIARLSTRHIGVEMGGSGMNMAFALVYNMSNALYRGRFRCNGNDGSTGRGRRCPANDHVNERGEERERGYRKGRLHSDAGYALSHRSV